MDYKTLDEVLEISEPISTHVSVPCGATLRERYKSVANRLEQIGPRKKKILTKWSREALEKVLMDIEALLEHEKAS